MLSGKLRKGGAMGNIETTPEDEVRARLAKYARKASRKKKPKKSKKKKSASKSVWTVSGGLPSLGKRR
jgi:hypothetical protein